MCVKSNGGDVMAGRLSQTKRVTEKNLSAVPKQSGAYVLNRRSGSKYVGSAGAGRLQQRIRQQVSNKRGITSLRIAVMGILALAVGTGPLFADVVAEWHMDAGQGNVVADTSGHARHGTIIRATWTDGILGGVLEFDGAAHVEAPNVPTSEFTLEAWVNVPTAPNDYAVILEKWLTGQGGAWILSVQPGLGPQIDWGVPNAGIATDSTVPIELNRWHYLAATVSYDAITNRSTATTYIDG